MTTAAGFPDLRGEFSLAGVLHLACTAPKDGTPIAARNVTGDVELIRWRTGADLDEGAEPYWAMYSTDEPFDFTEWIPSPMTDAEILEFYG